MVNNIECLDIITNCRRGCVIAPAGCGKTEQIALAAMHGAQRRLILTHTLAGVDALRTRLKDKGADPEHYQITTIAAWSLRIAGAFPLRSGLSLVMPTDNKGWDSVYGAATKLLGSKCIDSIIKASYSGVFVDEYQDCTRLQHDLICALTNLLPCCVFGDPLQSIFGFSGNPLPDWDKEVLREFPIVAEFRQPWRWQKVNNQTLGEWLLKCRVDLQDKGEIDLRGGPPTVIHETIAGNHEQELYRNKVSLVMKTLQKHQGEKCIIIGDSQNEKGRAFLARDVKACAVESITCKRLVKFVKEIEGNEGIERLDAVLKLVKDVMSGADIAALKKVVKNVAEGRRKKELDVCQAACMEIIRSKDLKPILDLLEEIQKQRAGWIYRRELYSALCGALRIVISGATTSLSDAIWDVQNRRRHSGRRFAKRSIGSTLLIKGLEFDHAIIVDVERLSRNDLYVALTRGSRSITVISKYAVLRPRR